MAAKASNTYQTLKKFSRGYVLHHTNSTPMFPIFIKSQIYIYSYLTILPDNFHLPPPQQKKAAYLTVLPMPPSTSQVWAKSSQHPLPFKIWVTTTALGSWARSLPKAFFPISSNWFLPSLASCNWLPKGIWNRKINYGISVWITCEFWSLGFSNCTQPNRWSPIHFRFSFYYDSTNTVMSTILKILLSSSSLNALVPTLLAVSTGFETENPKIILALELIFFPSQHLETADT